MPDTAMTKGERDELAKVIRSRERVAKADADQRGAELMAEFEEQIAWRYSFDEDEVWRAAAKAADDAVAAANEQIDRRCGELGIPKQFRPSISGPSWYSRGENGVAERRAELRRVAKTRVDALVKQAKHEIARKSVETQEQLVAGALDSAEARRFLEAMPTAESLMPQLQLAEIEAQPALPRRRW